MSSQALRAVSRADARFFARIRTIGRQLKDFRPEVRPAVTALARRHPRLAELSVSFPALLVALASPCGRFDAEDVIAGAVAGRPLASLAQAARVPLWLRRMAPRMLPMPLPPLPDNGFIRHRIVNHFPRHARNAPLWFEAVSLAHLWAHDSFALWCAQAFAGARTPRRRRVGRRQHPRPSTNRLPLLCLWAWYSGQDHRAATLIRTPWRLDMALPAAWKFADDWAVSLELDLNLGRQSVDPWLVERAMDGHTFVPLTSAAAIAEEASAMRNCVRTYSDGLIHDRLRLFSMRKDGVRLATVCVGWLGEDPLPTIEALRLAGNRDAPAALWWIARKWLNAQDVPALARTQFAWDTAPIDRAAWRALWRPYWLAKERMPDWLPLTPSRDALRRLTP